MIFYLPFAKQKRFFEKNKNIKKVPFNFTNIGSQIIFNKMTKFFSHSLMENNILPIDLKK